MTWKKMGAVMHPWCSWVALLLILLQGWACHLCLDHAVACRAEAELKLRATACLAVQAETLQMGGEAVVAAAAGMPDDQLSQTVQDQAAAQAQDLFRRAVQAYEQVYRPR